MLYVCFFVVVFFAGLNLLDNSNAFLPTVTSIQTPYLVNFTQTDKVMKVSLGWPRGLNQRELEKGKNNDTEMEVCFFLKLINPVQNKITI